MDGWCESPGPGNPAPGAMSGAVPGGGSLGANTHASAPLAVRMRPRTIDELVGQQQLRAAGSPLRRLIEGDQSMSLLLGVDDQGSPVPGSTPVPVELGPTWSDRWFDVKSKTMVSA